MEEFEALVELNALKENAIKYLQNFYKENKDDKEAVPMATAFFVFKNSKENKIETVPIPGGEFFMNNEGKNFFAHLLRSVVSSVEREGHEVLYYMFSSEIWLAASDDPKDPRNQPGPTYVPPSEREDSTDAVMIMIESKTFAEMILYDMNRTDEGVILTPKEETLKRLTASEIGGRFSGILCK